MKRWMPARAVIWFILGAFALFGNAYAQRDVPFVPTPQSVVDEMLRLAEIDSDDTVYDLGSGDGRIVITAAERYGARGVGVDSDPERIREAKENAQQAGVADRVEFIEGDLFKADLSKATAVTLYLLPSVNEQLRPKLLEELEPGTPIVSHSFDMGEWEPDQQASVSEGTIYKWTVPAKVAGTWRLDGIGQAPVTLNLNQKFQKVEGTAQVGDATVPLQDARLEGDVLRFTLADGSGQSFRGRVNEKKGAMEGVDLAWRGERLAVGAPSASGEMSD